VATYQDGQFLHHLVHTAFDAVYHPGTPTPHSGIYRCIVCGAEIASNASNPLPPQNHHQHSDKSPIRWKLLVYAVYTA
jgi:hypothetical protein